MEANRKSVVDLNIQDVLPNRFQPRIKFNEEAIIELSKSIKEHGVIQPIVVRPIGDKFEIIAGERRYKASCMAELKTIPAIITDLNDKDSAEVALIENVQRENLTPIEEAISYKKILDMGYITQDALATKLGKTQSTVANKLRLLNLDDEVQEALLKEKISERHARSLLKLTDKEKQKEMLNRIITERLTVRRADEEIDKMLSGKIESSQPTKIEMPNILQTPEESQSTTEVENEENQTIKEIETPFSESFKFINPNIPPEAKTNEEEFEEEFEEESEEELKQRKFFNILEEKEESENTSQEPLFSFDKMFIEANNESTKTNAMMEEINEIENSINNSATLPPILTETPEENKVEETTENSSEEENIDFIEEEPIEDDESEENELKESEAQPETISERRIDNFKDVLEEIRTCGNKIEKAGFEIETEEIDLNGEYQVIFKIKNN